MLFILKFLQIKFNFAGDCPLSVLKRGNVIYFSNFSIKGSLFLHTVYKKNGFFRGRDLSSILLR